MCEHCNIVSTYKVVFIWIFIQLCHYKATLVFASRNVKCAYIERENTWWRKFPDILLTFYYYILLHFISQ